jgi:hypothetical protein
MRGRIADMNGGLLIFLAVLAVSAGAVLALHFAIRTTLVTRVGWWRTPPKSVRPLAEGTISALWKIGGVVRATEKATRARVRSFNYNAETRRYQLFEGWLVNWTQRVPGTGVEDDKETGEPRLVAENKRRVTGMLVLDSARPPPAPCCKKIRADMLAYDLDPYGRMSAERAADKTPYRALDGDARVADWRARAVDGGGAPTDPLDLTAIPVDERFAPSTAGARPRDDRGRLAPEDAPRALIAVGTEPTPLTDDATPNCTDSCGWCTTHDSTGACTSRAAAAEWGVNEYGVLVSESSAPLPVKDTAAEYAAART